MAKIEDEHVTVPDGSKLVKLRDRVEVTATDSNPYLKAGESVMVHPLIAEKGRKDGFYELEKKGK